MKTALIVAAFSLIAVGVAAAFWFAGLRSSDFQSTEKPPLEILRPVASREGDLITKPDGWLLIDISKLEKSAPREKSTSTENKAEIYRTLYNPGALELSKMNFDGTIDPVRKVSVKGLAVYDINNRPFCYRLMFWEIPLEGEDGYAVVTNSAFYDLDGDGKFELWDVADSPLKPLRMPYL